MARITPWLLRPCVDDSPEADRSVVRYEDLRRSTSKRAHSIGLSIATYGNFGDFLDGNSWNGAVSFVRRYNYTCRWSISTMSY